MAAIVCPRASGLRAATSTKQIVSASRSSKSPLSTTSQPATRRQLHIQASRPSIVARIPPSKLLTSSTALIRHASTTTSPSVPSDVLTWNRFFDLRRKRRYLNLGASVITSGAAIGTFGPVIAQQDIDGWAAQISGLDPIIVLGITTFAVAAGGWLCGPSFGSALFKVWAGRRGWNQAIGEKEKSFFARIRRYRADPSSSSPQNPIPDYYGEKIASVKDYRRWLKDQRAFNLKKNKNMI